MAKNILAYVVRLGAIAVIAGIIINRYQYFRYLLANEFVKISWVYAIGLYFLLSLALMLMVSIICRAFNLGLETKLKAWLLVISICIGFSVAEITMRKAGWLALYSENRNDFYNSYFLPLQDSGWFHVLPPHHEMYLEGPEFKYYRKTNSLGYPDKEPTVEKQQGEIRLLTLGDSFTAGDGAPFDSSYPQLLVKMLAERYPERKISLVNAGMFGSDPYFNYIALRENLLKYKPDVVLETIAGGDLYDIYYHGNLGRFKPGGQIQFNQSPWWEPVYAISRVSRIYFKIKGYGESMLPQWKQHEIFEAEKRDLKDLYIEYHNLADKHNFKVIVLLRPDREECESGAFFNKLEDMAQYPKELDKVQVVNLLSYYKDTKQLKPEDFKRYYWPIDGHHNSKGYQLMAEGAFTAVAPLIDSIQ